MDIATIAVDNDKVSLLIKNSKYVFEFGNEHPGASVTFSICNKDKDSLFVYTIPVVMPEPDKNPLGGIGGAVKSSPGKTVAKPEANTPKAESEDPKPSEEAPVEKVEPQKIELSFEVDKIENGNEVVLNYSSKPEVTVLRADKRVFEDKSVRIESVDINGAKYDGTKWKLSPPAGGNQKCLFTFEGEVESDVKYSFIIPCTLKDKSKINLVITLKPKPKQLQEEQKPAEPEPEVKEEVKTEDEAKPVEEEETKEEA